MPYLMHAGRLLFASAFIMSALRELYGFELNGGVAAEELRPKLSFFENQAKYIVGLGIVMKILGGILFILNTYLGALLLFVNETVSADEGVAMSLYSSIVNEESRQKLCNQLNEIATLAISNPLFTPSEFNTLFMKFINGVGIVAALVNFIAIKHKHGMFKKPSKKQKTN